MSGFENLRKSLVKEAKKEARKIDEKAGEEAGSAIGLANMRAKKEIEEAMEKASRIVAEERDERLGSAKIRSKRIVADSVNRVIDNAMERLWEEFAGLPKAPGYGRMLERIIESAEKELGGKTRVYVNANDLQAAKKISKNVSQKTIQISGGAVISSNDGKVEIDGSFESIFESKKAELRKIISNGIYGKGA